MRSVKVPTAVRRKRKAAANRTPDLRWLYVEARDLDSMVSFDSVFVQAPTEEEAYLRGAALLAQEADRLPISVHKDHFNGVFLNDYVVQV